VAYAGLTAALGEPWADRIDGPATRAQKARLAGLAASDFPATSLAGEPVTAVLDHAPGNGEPIGGLKVCTASGWFAARPSGTEDLYKIYAERPGTNHLKPTGTSASGQPRCRAMRSISEVVTTVFARPVAAGQAGRWRIR